MNEHGVSAKMPQPNDKEDGVENRYVGLRIVTGVVCVYHVLLGVVLNMPVASIASIAEHLLGATRMPDASALFLARMLGVYLIVFGLGMGAAAWNPMKNRTLLTLGAILVAMRAVQRCFQAGDLQTSLGIESGTNTITILILVVFAIALALFRLKLFKEEA